jgi:hypothetical protein
MFWALTPCSPLKVNRIFGCSALLATCFMLVSRLTYSLTPKMEATRSDETSVEFQLTTWYYIPGDRTLRNHRCESLKSYYSNNC